MSGGMGEKRPDNACGERRHPEPVTKPTAESVSNLEELGQQLLRGGVGSMVVKVAATTIAFFLAVVLARALGPEGYGAYAFVLSIIMLLAIPAQVGLPQLVVRETAKAHANKHWGLMRGLWRWGNRFVALFSALMVGIGILVLWIGGAWLEDTRWETLAVGLALVPLIALGNVRGAALRGLRRVVVGQLPEQILRPGLSRVMVLALIWWWPSADLNPPLLMGLHGGAALIAFATGAALLWCIRPAPLFTSPPPDYQASFWRQAAMPLALLGGLQIINAHMGIIMLGLLSGDEEVGIYRVAVQVATLVVFGLQAVNQVLQPYFVRLHAQGDLKRLQQLVTSSARIILLLAFPPVLVMVVAGAPLLGLLFGEEYRPGALTLAIIGVAQLINAGMGSVGVLLNMTGHERDTLRGVAVAAIANVMLNLVLIPLYGMEGAATAMALTLVVWNLLLWRAVRRRLGINSSAIQIRSAAINS